MLTIKVTFLMFIYLKKLFNFCFLILLNLVIKLSFILIVHQIILVLNNIFNWVHDLIHLLIMNIPEFTGFINSLLMLLILRVKVRDLIWILSKIEEDLAKKVYFTLEEKKIFETYDNRSNKFAKIMALFIITVYFYVT